MSELIMKDLKERMSKAVDALKKEFQGLRTGRANPSLLENIRVNAYGSIMPINQVASVSAPEPRMLSVQVWDASLATHVEKAIRESELGLNPSTEGAVIRIPLPDLSQERRKELSKVAAKYAEQAKVAVRNIRRDGMDVLKKQEKDGDISEDDHRSFSTKIQTLTDETISSIDKILSEKETDILGAGA